MRSYSRLLGQAFFEALSPPDAPKRRGGVVGGDACQSNQGGEGETVHSQHGFTFAVNECQSQQQRGKNTSQNGAREATGNAKRPIMVSFANSKRDQGDELQNEAGTVKHDIQRHEPFEAEAQ